MVGKREKWPKEILLKSSISFPLVFEGKVVGSLKVPLGSTVQLLEVARDHVTVGYNNSTAVIPIKATNLNELAATVMRMGTLSASPSPAIVSATMPVSTQQTSSMPAPNNREINAVDFSKSAAWVTAPFEFLGGTHADLTIFNRGKKIGDPENPPVTIQTLSQGTRLSSTHARNGKDSLEWRDHQRYPTIATRSLVTDWTPYKNVAFSIYSELATGEVVTLGIRSDNPSTLALDFFTHDFTVDWTGWKDFSLPFSEFHAIGVPLGWKKVEEIDFFTKIGRRSPDPRTVLSLTDLHLDSIPSTMDERKSVEDTVNVFADVTDAPIPALNHEGPEFSKDWPSGKPCLQAPYFHGLRALNNYFPKYDTGYVSFDPKGKPYLKSPNFIETLDETGKWTRISIEKEIRAYAASKKWPGVWIGMGDPVIRFDSDGDMYVITNIERTDALGKRSGMFRTAVLQHSGDLGKTWTLYPLPLDWASFERLDGHNTECLKHPPVIIQQDQTYFPGTDQDAYFLLPEKSPTGTLTIPPKMRFAHDALLGPGHSGGGNVCISQGDKIFFVYGSMPEEASSINPKAKFKESVEEWRKSLPPIPFDHPALSMSAVDQAGKSVEHASEGVPSYVVCYDRTAKKLGNPVFVGFGGFHLDGHNWSAITADSKGILHILVNGHINPLLYTHSLNPGDVASWSKPIYLPSEPGSQKYTYASYASLNCDVHDNLLSIIRSDTGAYNHRLAVLRKAAGKEWEAERSLLVPFWGGYHVWHNKIGYDLLRDRFFLAYTDQCGMIQMSSDGYYFYRFIWPDVEPAMCAAAAKDGKLDKGYPKPENYSPGAAELTVLVSDDGGISWRLATTPDFAKR